MRTVTLAGDWRVIAAAHAEAGHNGWHISVVVVDAGGQLAAFDRFDADDGRIGVSGREGLQKARSAALLRASSGEFNNFINHGRPGFVATPGTPLEGGVPLAAGEVIGAVVVSGAHGANDSQMTQAAAAAVRE
ncbi:GlcG/HbpS family heme-binding protein [Affinibrenneria salicis]|uniref:GlcG/HbpS family heme-binding protein n=1 Tax=Affinibrenneria salicis TaxID=2590031 RepID=UPI001CC6DF84|nr:heme-binding protein [Affinibrenneria salicis]